jgi:hypothetical protein
VPQISSPEYSQYPGGDRTAFVVNSDDPHDAQTFDGGLYTGGSKIIDGELVREIFVLADDTTSSCVA